MAQHASALNNKKNELEALQRSAAVPRPFPVTVPSTPPHYPAPSIPQHPGLTQAHTYPVPSIYSATATGRGRPPIGGMAGRRPRPAFNLQDIAAPTQPTTGPPSAPPAINANGTNEGTDSAATATTNTNTNTSTNAAIQNQNPPLINRARLGAGRPLPLPSPQAGPSQPSRRPIDLSSPFAGFSEIVYVSSFSFPTATCPHHRLLAIPQVPSTSTARLSSMRKASIFPPVLKSPST